MSLDGFIATTDDSLEFLNPFMIDGEDYGYSEFTSTVDTYLVGRKTYDVVCTLTGGTFPPAEQFQCYVLSKSRSRSENGITYYNGDLIELINQLKSTSGKNIYCDGGGQIVRELLEIDAIDEFIISVLPILLGKGKRLFPGADSGLLSLQAHEPKKYENGLIQLRYSRENR